MRRREREKGVEREKTRKSVRPSVRPRDGCWVWRAGVCGVCMYIHTYVCICVCVCVCMYTRGQGKGGGGKGESRGGTRTGRRGEKVGKKWGKRGRDSRRATRGGRDKGTRDAGGKGAGGKKRTCRRFRPRKGHRHHLDAEQRDYRRRRPWFDAKSGREANENGFFFVPRP